MNHMKTAPLLQSQLGIYLQCKRLGTAAYNQHWLYILDDTTDPDRLALAIDRVMAFFPSLNIRLREQDGQPVQYIPEADAPYRQRVERMTEEQWEREKADLVARPMKLLDSRLLCFHVVQTERAKYLFQSAHHVLFDGKAMQRLADVISEVYAGNEPGEERRTVLDAAAAEADERQGKIYRKAREWYELHFSGIDVESMPLPDGNGKDDFKACIRLLPIQETQITTFCREKGYSTSALTSGAFAVTMGVCTYRQEALFSTIWNGRNTDYAGSFGMFVKTLPVYASWDRKTTTADFLSRLTEMIRESRKNSLFSYADLNRICPMEHSPMFAWHGRFRDIPSLCGFPCRQEVLDSALDDTPLSVDLMATDEGLSLRIEYNAGKYSGGFVETLARTYEEILAQLMTKETLGAIDPCPGGTVDGDFNETAFPVDYRAVHIRMEAQAERNPEATAFVAAGERLSYRELNEKANRLAHSLREICPKGMEFIVGMLLPRTTAVPVAEYGIWKAGGAFLPMSAEYPDDRVETCLRDAGCALCITTQEELRKRPALFSPDKPYKALTVEMLCGNPKSDNPGMEVPSAALAYVIYTSGSTGRPKGVMLEHGNLCNFLDANEKNLETRTIVESGSVMLSVAAISFDFSMMELHIPLTHGGTCVMATEEEILNAGPLAQLITQEHVDEMCCTPSFFSNALQFDALCDALRGIKLIDFGAEAFPPALYQRIREAGLAARILNGYGPTEATISCICREITGDEKITIGTPASNVRAWVMDPYGHELPAGMAGELVIGGLGVGRGYRNLKEKTEAVFFEYKKERAYRTGDIVRLLPDEKKEGKYTLDYLGRGDRQVKIRGFRVELGEVESVIREAPGVTDTVVIAAENPDRTGSFLAAYVVMKKGTVLDTHALRDFIRERKPYYMAPSVMMQLDAIPLTANGKVDRKALPVPVLTAEADRGYIQPRGDTEKRICRAVSEVTGTAAAGVDASFEEMGVTSLLMMSLTVKLGREFDTALSFADLQEYDTPEKLAVYLENAGGQEEKLPVLEEYPVTKTQEGIFFESQTHSGTTVYNIPTLIELDDSIDTQRLKTAVAAAINAHSYLLTRFCMSDDGQLRQRREEDAAFKAEDVAILQSDSPDMLRQELLKPFDLLSDRLVRICIATTGDGKRYLYIDAHHCVFDGVSSKILLRDIERSYAGASLEVEHFTGWEAALIEEKQRSSDIYEKSKTYYSERFAGMDGDWLPVPDNTDNSAGGSGWIQLDGSEADIGAVMDFCRKNGIGENAFFCAVFGLTAAAFGGGEESVFATINNGRSDARFADSVSMFVRTYPVLCRPGSGSVLDYLRETERQLKDSLYYGAYSFEEISRDLGIRSDLFFAWQGEKNSLQSFCGAPCREIELDLKEAKAPLMLQVFTDGGKVQYHCEFYRDRYSDAFISGFIREYDHCAAEMLLRSTVDEICLCTQEELKLLDSFNSTAVPYDDSQTVVSLFRQAAERYPGNTAVIFKDKCLTYTETDAISDRIAAAVLTSGIRARGVVSVLIPRGEYMPLASLGALKAGCAYQPLDPGYPPERLNFMIRDADALFLITTRELRGLITDYDGPVLFLEDIPDLKDGAASGQNIAPADPFILLYTSGSTGTPKGVRLTHGNLVCFIHWYQHFYDLKPESRTGAYASYGFDACMMDMYPALTTGAAVCIIPEEIRLDLNAINGYLEKNGVTHLFMTTQVGRQYASEIEKTCLQYLSVGGEKLAPLTFASKSRGYRFFNGYGPTEATIFSTIYEVRGQEAYYPIGRPLDNMKLYVVDNRGRRVPAGVPGELWIAGPQVGDGYLDRPEKTAEVFTDNPFDCGATRVYRTGDIVRWLADGNIQFIGRRDGQVKIRGFRVETAEIEAVIREFPGVKEVTVQAYDNPDGSGKFLAAYVVGADRDHPVDVQALDSFILSRKPPYMVPAVTMQIDAIPLNQNQKVNRRALPEPEIHAQKDNAAGTAAPLNVLEQELKNIVAEITGTDEFGITDAFRDLGLTSISAIRLATKLFKRFDVQVNVQQLLSGGCIQSVENTILEGLLNESTGREEPGTGQEKPAQEPQAQSCRLTFSQQGVYTEYQANPDTVQYNMPFAIGFPGGITAKELEAALRKVIGAHPYILCRFVPDSSGEIIQEPIPAFTPEIPVLELSGAELEKHKTEFVRPFDLAKGPAVRFEIIRSDTLTLLADMHHLVSDGASMDLFLEQLCEALDGKEPEQENYSYYDYAAGEKVDPEAEDFFAGQMAAMEEATQLIPDVFKADLAHREKSVSIPTDIASVTEFARKAGVTPAAVYVSAAFLTLGRYVCDDTVAIATVSNGRSNLKISNTMGMFVNTLPLVMKLDNGEKTEDYIRREAKTFSGTIAHEHYPFACIASKYDFHPGVSLTYQIGVLSEYRIKAGPLVLEDMDLDVPKLPAAVYIDGTEKEAVIRVDYDSALYSAEMMFGLVRSMENVVQGLMNSETLAGISLTGENEWKVLDGFNRPWNLEYSKTDTVVSAFRRSAKANPDKPAAVFRDKTWTYRELDELTDQLAAKLYRRACEVTGKTDLVEEVAAILIHRDENVFILPLAAVKAGLAYEPLDPGYPKDRLNFMVKDAGVCLLLAEEDLLGMMDEYHGAVLTVEELYGMEKAPVLPAGPKPEDLFILLYTSGSTGTPKGCQIEHRNVVSYAHGVHNDFYTKEDRIAAYASFGFDVNMSDVFCTLLNGGTLVLIPEEIRMDLKALAEYFDEAGITALLLTTQVGVQFLTNYPKLKTLRMLVMGGEKLPAVDPASLSYTIVNGYGPTENCCGVSLFPIRVWEPNIPIGKPMSTIHAFILDRTGHRLPAGAAGEYCLSGPQVTRGYLNRPDKTAQAYGPCPFNEFRMYHTGDIVRYRQNGDVEFVGRRDGQVKIRGFRIETKEVESVIRSFPGISDVTVQAYDYETGGKYLAAFVTGQDKVDIAKLTEYIRTQKPAYMVPAVIMQIDKIPLTVNQKVDKKALPEPKLQKAAYTAPVGKTEEDFCTIFGSALGIEHVSAEDDFFDVGGSSILAMKVVMAAEKAGYHIVYNDVFHYPTPRAIAGFLSGSKENAGETAAAPAESDAPAIPEVGKDGYDYSRIHDLLRRNTLEAFLRGARLPLNDVFLLGATGYLGSHVLHELILNHDNRIYCLVRPGKDQTGKAQSGKERLQGLLHYYFQSDFEELFGSRITVLEGDATEPDSLAAFKAPSADMTVINCAASVKHFARGDEIERANVDSVRNLTLWCEENKARLVHISTGSVAGTRHSGMPPLSFRFDEHSLFAGQVIDNNQYVHSKFMAERCIYEEMLKHGLRAKVLRMGNLAPREEDGEFQINYRTNSYMNNFRAFQTLGMVSFELLDQHVEFSPIDCLAKAVLALAGTPDECILFIPLNPHRPLIGDVVRALNEEGYPVRGAETEEFSAALHEALLDEKKREAVSSLAAYDSNDNTQEIGPESCDNSLTMQILARLGFSWPETGTDYIRRFLRKLGEKGYFRGDEA